VEFAASRREGIIFVTVQNNQVDIKIRKTGQIELLEIDQVLNRVKKITGETPDSKYFLQYLNNKFSKIYQF
jgi:Zn-dependent M32 family carboxypeptidase